MTRLTEEGRRFNWEKDCQTAFEQLKHFLTSAPILSYPLPEGNFVLDTDASNVGIGGVLSQVQNRQEKVLAYFSKTGKKLLRHAKGIASSCEVGRTLLQIFVRPKVPDKN